MYCLLLYFMSFCIFLIQSIEGKLRDEERYGEEINSRFILTSDLKINSLVDIPLRSTWWSRGHEYAWAAQFADADLIVLDAACGISHPFKWYLGEVSLETWACDTDPRISKMSSIIKETYDDLGKIAYTTLINNPILYNQVKLINASICSMPINMPRFDRIFCISTFEHLSHNDQIKAIAEFSRLLTPDGLIILTVDYPEVAPEVLLEIANSVDLVPAGEVLLERPSNDVLTNGYLSIYRCVLRHKQKEN